jgi:hypothetical protein
MEEMLGLRFVICFFVLRWNRWRLTGQRDIWAFYMECGILLVSECCAEH